jgi:predicted AAA+ superfamily ATPase
MFKRKLATQLAERLKEPRRFIQIVAGPRQTGKTTAVLQALEGQDTPIRFVSADDPNLVGPEWLKNEWAQARALAKAEGGANGGNKGGEDGDGGEAILVIDEIQKIPKWSSIVKLLWDEDSRLSHELKVVLTGSSSLLLQKGLSESLMGRFEMLYSPHWSYSECREAFGYSFDDFLFFGGYPGAATLITDEDRWARYMGTSIVEPTIAQDILMMEEVRKPALLRALFMLGSGYSAQELSFTKMIGQLDDAGNTVTLAHYLDLLEKAGILAGLRNYHGSQIRVRKSSPRLLVYDTSLMTYAGGTDRRRFLSNAVDRGHLVESAVGAYLLARGREEGFEVYWWRDRGDEVDFVIKKGGLLTAIEVKSGRVKNAGGGLVFKKAYPEALSLIVGGAAICLEDFLLGNAPLFL